VGATRQATRQTVDSAGVPDEKAGDFNELLTTTIDVTRAIKTGYQSSSLWDSGCHHGTPLQKWNQHARRLLRLRGPAPASGTEVRPESL